MKKIVFLAVLVFGSSAVAIPPYEPGELEEEERSARAIRNRQIAIEEAPLRQARAVESLRDEVAALRKEIAVLRLLLARLMAKQWVRITTAFNGEHCV